ncbi:MAG: hypothetical protein GY821_08735 [Gammaproteobacteria bacterium]|nr:hypothetical protein [Gammaproteobacteria bacterium]
MHKRVSLFISLRNQLKLFVYCQDSQTFLEFDVCTSGDYTGVIRAELIYLALKWLQRNNPLYSEVDIDYDVLPINVDRDEISDFIETGMIPIDYDFPTLTVSELIGLNSARIDFPRSIEKPLSFEDTYVSC